MNPPQKINYTALTNAQATAGPKKLGLDKKRFIIYTIIAVVLFVGWSIVKYIGFALLVWLAYVSVYSYRAITEQKKIVMQILTQFSADNSFSFSPKEKYFSWGVVFKVGNHDHKTEYILRGQMNGYNFATYWHQFTTGSGKSQTTHKFGVVELDLPKELPHMFIDSKKNNTLGYEILDEFKRSNIIDLEGNFPDNYRVYAAKDYEVEALTILNPAFMAKLIDLPVAADFELNENKAFIYFKNSAFLNFVLPEKELKEHLAMTDFLITELTKSLDTFTMAVHEKVPNEIERSPIKSMFS